MIKMPRRTITDKTPMTAEEIKQFADEIEAGDSLYAMAPYRVWTSSTNFNIHYKPAKVTILKKYPHVVETSHGRLMWKELLIGYYNYRGPSDPVKAGGAAEKRLEGKPKQTAA